MRWSVLLLALYSYVAIGAQSYMLLPIVDVYDADTIKTNINKLPEPLNKFSIRVRGIDTPEQGWRAKCEAEAQLAIEAKQYLISLIGDKTTMKVTDYKHDKYGGRIVANVRINGYNISETLLSAGYAVPYDGGKKTHDWCVDPSN